MNKHTRRNLPNCTTSRKVGLIALLGLAAATLLLAAWPNAMAAAQTTVSSSEPVLLSDGPLPDVPIVFVSRNRMETLDGTRVGPPLDIAGRELTPGGRLLVWRPDGSVTDLTAGTSLYDVQQPDVSFDGTKVVFSAVTGQDEQWHLYEIGLDGTGLRQITFDDRDIEIPEDPRDPGRTELMFSRYGDFGPAYLPDGRIIFVSTRYMTLSGSCGQRGLNLYVLDPESGEMRRRTTERSGAIDPFVLSDGTVVFSHWIDAMNEPALDGPGLRPLETDENFGRSLWAIWDMNPDATGAHRYAFLWGGLEDGGGGVYQPHELPDGSLVVTVRGVGALLGHTLANAITRIEPGLVEPHEPHFLGDPYNLEGPHALAPAPLADGRIVCSYTPTSTVETDQQGRLTASFDFGLYVVDEDMSTLAPLYNDPETDELDAVAVYARSAPVIPDCSKADLITDDPTVELGTTATMINHNVYADLALDVVDLPSPKVGTVVRVDFYDDSQTFTTSDEFPLLRKQMPHLVGSFPVDENGAFTAVVPADKPLLFVLVNENGVAVRTLRSLTQRPPFGLGYSLTHSFNGHDYLRPDDGLTSQAIQCTGCHLGHMMQPELATEAQANLSRLALATASSERVPFFEGAWRANDLRLAEEDGRYSWTTGQGPGAWVQLDWPIEIEATQAVLYPLTAGGCHVTAATLTLSDGTSYSFGPLPEDGSPLVIPFDPPSTISWMRFTVDAADPSTGSGQAVVGLAELVVNGPPDVELPDTPPAPPTDLSTTDGGSKVRWSPTPDAGLAGYKLYYGTAPGEYTESLDVGNVSWFQMRGRLEDGVTYYIAAKAYNIYGTESETFSDEVTALVHAPIITSVQPDAGPIGGGTLITITGENFAPRSVKVFMGGVGAFDVRIVDDQTITAMTPAHRDGTVDVVVTNPSDLSGVLPDGFTYEAEITSLPGDVNGDCVVDIVDIVLVAAHWGAQDGDADYDPQCDLNQDGSINIADIMLVARHWGETCD